MMGARCDTAAGARAVLGSQRVRLQSQRRTDLTVLAHSRPLRAEDGSRSVRFGCSCALAAVSQRARMRGTLPDARFELRASSFVILSSFGIRHSSFEILWGNKL